MDKTERPVRGPVQRPLGRRLHQTSCGQKRKSRDSYVNEKPSQERARALPQRKGTFQSKEQRKKGRGDQRDGEWWTRHLSSLLSSSGARMDATRVGRANET